MLQRAMRACGQRFGLQTLLLGYLLLLGFATPGFALSTGAGKAAAQASASNMQVELEGELQVMHEDDFKNRKSRTRHFLKTVAGERYELKFSQRAPHYPSGSKVRVRGSKSGNLLALDSGSGSTQVLALPSSNTLGEQKTAVILVNFQDNTTQPQTVSFVQNLVFSTINSFYLESSFQQTSLSGKVLGWFTIPIASTTCDPEGIKKNARAAAMAAGADLSGYSRFVYMFPKTSACSWAGLAVVGGSPTDAWINGYFDQKTVTHELGHNFGLIHAHSMNCDVTAIGNTCTGNDYGDVADTMGNGRGQFNSYAKEYLGWLNVDGQPPITTVQSSGSYVISPYESSDLGVKALKILRSTDSSTGESTWYYLEYRQPLGFDSVLASVGNMAAGVTIRSGHPAKGSYLLDMTPNSNTVATSYDTMDGALIAGSSFSDPAAGVSIKVTWANTSGAGVDVIFDQTACKRSAPIVTVSPSSGQPVAAGTTVNYTVAVSNLDTSSCGVSSFNLGATLPAGWSGIFNTSSLSLMAGSASSTVLAVTSPSTAMDGTYNLGIKASNSSNINYSSNGSTSYNVISTSSLTQAVVTDKTAYKLGDTITATSTVTNGGQPVSGASVLFSLIKPNGGSASQTVTTGSNGQAKYKYRLSKGKDPTGAYKVDAVAVSNGKTASATTSFTAQ